MSGSTLPPTTAVPAGAHPWLRAVVWAGLGVSLLGSAARLGVMLTSNQPGMGGTFSRLDAFRRLDGSAGPPGSLLFGLPLQVLPGLVALGCAWLAWHWLRRDDVEADGPRWDRWLLAALALRSGLTVLTLSWLALTPGPGAAGRGYAMVFPLVAVATGAANWALAVGAGMGLARLRATRPAVFADWALLLVPLSLAPLVSGAVGWIDVVAAHGPASVFDATLRHPWTSWGFGGLAGWAVVRAGRRPRRYWVAPTLFWSGMAALLLLQGLRMKAGGMFAAQSFFPPLLPAVASGLLLVVLRRVWMRVAGAVLLVPILWIGLLLGIAVTLR